MLSPLTSDKWDVPGAFDLDALSETTPAERPAVTWAVSGNVIEVVDTSPLPVVVPSDLSEIAARLLAPAAKTKAAPRRSTRSSDQKKTTSPTEESGYRFPYSRIHFEPTPDTSGAFGTEGTFGVRLAWQKGKTVLPLIETTALRPIAQVTLNGQRYPVSLSQHGRKKRDRVVLAGRRKTARSPRCALRFVCVISGREERLTWHWRIAATSAAIAYDERQREEKQQDRTACESIPDEVALFLPFAPGRARVVEQVGIANVFVLWMNDIAVSVAWTPTETTEGVAITPVLEHSTRGFTLTLRQNVLDGESSLLAGRGVSLQWETWATPARTEAEARTALLRHAADLAERSQTAPDCEPAPLTRFAAQSEAVLMDPHSVDKRGVDRLAFRAISADGTTGSKRHSIGEGTDAALAACALLGRFYQNGDDAMRRHARLIARDVCDFQIQSEDSAHWGAMWDVLTNKKQYSDGAGGATVSVATTARAAKGLLIAHAHFGTEILSRTALGAAQWLLLRLDRDGAFPMERWSTDGPPSDNTPRSPWTAAESLAPLVETFRTTKNETYLKAALRIVEAFKTGLSDGKLGFETASSEYLASAVEGVLNVSREYESAEMIDLARRIALGLRVRRLPDGSLAEPFGLPAPISPLAPTLAGARAALALTRVDNDPLWLILALRAIRYAGFLASEQIENGKKINVADHAGLLALPIAVLLCAAQRAKGIEADRDRLTLKRGWQTFSPDPATREYVKVTTPDGGPVDYLALVCPISLQVMVSVVASPNVTEVKITKNNRSPFVRNLLNGEIDLTARLVPLGDGTEANTGVFLLDT